MIEAVNSVLANASYTRAPAEQISVAASFAANPDRVQQAPVQAPYLSLYIKVDVDFNKAVLQVRDIDTGDVVRQIPSESQLEAYRRAQSSNAVRPATVEEADTVKISQEAQDTQTKVVSSTPEKTSAPIPQQTPAPQVKASVSAAPAPQPQTQTASVDTQA